MIFMRPVYATCPVCVITAGGGLWLAQKLGVDDLIASLWIGSLTTAFALAFADKFRLLRLPRPRVSWTVISYLLTILFLELTGHLNNPNCKIWGICKIWLGVTVGTAVFWLGVLLDEFLRTKNEGRVFFPFQKVFIPVLATLLSSLGFYLLIC